LLVYGGAATIVQLLYFAVIVQSVRHSPTPTSELELAEERAKCARLEKECQKAKVEADALAETNCKLEDKIREDKELLEEREKEVGQKDASIQRLEKEANEMQAKVSQIRRGMGSNR
jgi:chromosome segregation ATPase